MHFGIFLSKNFRIISLHSVSSNTYQYVFTYILCRCLCNAHSGTCNTTTGLDCDCQNHTKTVCPLDGNCMDYQVINIRKTFMPT